MIDSIRKYSLENMIEDWQVIIWIGQGTQILLNDWIYCTTYNWKDGFWLDYWILSFDLTHISISFFLPYTSFDYLLLFTLLVLYYFSLDTLYLLPFLINDLFFLIQNKQPLNNIFIYCLFVFIPSFTVQQASCSSKHSIYIEQYKHPLQHPT